MNEDDFRRRSWAKKFRDAFRGARQGVRGQGSFFVHVFFVAAVVLSAMALRVERIEWCALVLCITIVLAAEECSTGAGGDGPDDRRRAERRSPRRPGHGRRGRVALRRRGRGGRTDRLPPPLGIPAGVAGLRARRSERSRRRQKRPGPDELPRRAPVRAQDRAKQRSAKGGRRLEGAGGTALTLNLPAYCRRGQSHFRRRKIGTVPSLVLSRRERGLRLRCHSTSRTRRDADATASPAPR